MAIVENGPDSMTQSVLLSNLGTVLVSIGAQRAYLGKWGLVGYLSNGFYPLNNPEFDLAIPRRLHLLDSLQSIVISFSLTLEANRKPVLNPRRYWLLTLVNSQALFLSLTTILDTPWGTFHDILRLC